MENKWMKYRLGDVFLFNPKESIQKGKIAKKIAMDKLQPFTREITGYELAKFSGGTKFRNGDTLVARITPCLENGKTSQVSILEEDEIAFGSTEYIVLRAKEGITDCNFVYYFSINPNFRNIAIQSMVGSSGRQRVQQSVLENIEIDIPPLNLQQNIASILSSLDNKIELNNRINDNLEQQAQAIFKSWFADFEPFKDGEFVESELGRIPKGWCIDKIDNFVTEIKNGGTPNRSNNEYWNSKDIPWIKTGEINNKPLIECEEYITHTGLIKSSAKLLPINSVLIALYGATAGKIGLLRFEASTNQACCAMICDTINKSVFLYMYLFWNQKLIENLAIGSAQQNLSKETISNLLLTVPLDKVFEKLPFEDIYNCIETNMRENQRLVQLRDTLLPKLMSGELSVDDI